MSAGATSQRWTKTLVPLLHLYKVKIHRLLQYGKMLKVWGLGKVGLDVGGRLHVGIVASRHVKVT